MSDRDQNWGFGGRRGPDRGRREDDRRARGPSDERRSFEGGEPWHGEGRYGARYDEDRAYGGQVYGQEGGRTHSLEAGRGRFGGDERETWRAGDGAPYGDLELNPRNPGVEEFGPPADYAYHPREGHEFDPDYLRWREEQMRVHDRDYHDWRRNQRQAYDDDYRRFRSERRAHFGRTFQDWRSQQSPVGGVADTTVAPGVGGYGDKVGQPSGYDARSSSKPSGMIEPPEAMNASAGAGQTAAAGGRRQPGANGAGGDSSPEFGREPSQVQAAAGGLRKTDEER